MSTAVTYVGNQYNVPAYQDTGYAQGTGNLSSYLIALATGSLTLSGGTFTLTADVNFGATYGLISTYFTSRTTNAATSGAIRLANADNISWRDAGNTANLTLTVNSSNQFAFSGGDIVLGTGSRIIMVSPDGTKTMYLYPDNNGEFHTDV